MADKKYDKEDVKIQEDITKLYQLQTKSVQALRDTLEDITKNSEPIRARFAESLKEKMDGVLSLQRSLDQQIKDSNKTRAIQNIAMQKGVSTAMAELMLAKDLALKQAQTLGLRENEVGVLQSKYDKLIKSQVIIDQQLKAREEEKKIADKILEIDKDRQEILEKINVNTKLFKAIFTDSRAAAAFFTSQLIKGYGTVKGLFEDTRKEGLTVMQSFREVGTAMTDSFTGFFGGYGVSAKESLEVMKGMREEMGSIEGVTRKARLEAGSLALTFGISAEEAGKLTAQFATMPGATMDSANESLKFAGNLAKAAGVAPGAVMQDIAKNSEEVAKFSKDGGKNIAVAAVAAKKLGVEFGSLTKMADQLLDFESSINKQMEASVLLGREINLDKAREMANNGDIAGMTKEILANVGGEAEFNKMSLVQRKALAESMGMSVSELGKMIKNQDALNDLTQEQQEALASGEMSMDEILANSGGWLNNMKNIGGTIVAGVIGLGEFREGLNAAKDMAGGLFGAIKGGIKGMMAGGGLKGGLKGALGLGGGGAPEIPKTEGIAQGVSDKAGDLQKKAPDVDGKKGAGIGGFIGKLGEGLEKFTVKSLVGALFFSLAAAMLGIALAGVALGYKELGGDPMTLIGLGVAIAGFGLSMSIVGKMQGQIMQGALAMLVLGAALIPAAFAFSLLAGVDVNSIIAFSIALPLLALAAAGLGFLLIPIAMGALALAALGGGMVVVGAGLMVMQAGAGGLAVFQMLMVTMAEMGAAAAVGLTLTSIGLVAFGASALVALPGMFLMSFALMMLTPSLMLLNKIGENNSLGGISDSLVAIGAAREGLGGVGMAVMTIAGGLGLMAMAGIGALPAIGALIALAAVAPALTALSNSFGSMFGGGEEKTKEDKMDVLIAKIDQLITVASQGGTVNMDGKKVGDVIRLGLNSSGIR